MTARRKQSTGAVGMRPIAAPNASRHIGVGSTRRTARGPSGGATGSEGGRGSDTQSSLQTKSSVGDSYFVQGADSYCGDSLGVSRGRELISANRSLFGISKKMFSKMITNVPFIPSTVQLLTPERCIFGEFGTI